MKKIFFFLLIFSIFNTYSQDQIYFKDISEYSGIQNKNFVKDPKMNIPINDHSRLRVADINSDGFDDIIMHNLFPNPLKGIPFETLVFLNNKDKTFTDFSEESGLKDIQAGFMLFADFDNDGDQDAFAGLDIPLKDQINNIILKNDGNGHFKRVKNSGVELLKNHYTGTAAAADFDNDGILDLFVGNGQSSAVVEDFIYRGMGDLTFKKIENAFDEKIQQPTNGCICFDYDNDGDIDIFVSTYGVSVKKGHNILWENQGNFKFVNKALNRGIHGMPQGNRYVKSTGYGQIFERDSKDNIIWNKKDYIGSNGFGVDIADINFDGNTDLLITTISHPSEKIYSRKWSDPSMILINRGEGGAYRFENEAIKRKLPFCEGDIDSAFIDFDNDGYIDISISREKKYDSRYKDEEKKSWFGLMKGEKNGTFKSIGRSSGINSGGEYNKMKMGQNIAWFDIEHDGDLDLIVGGRSTGKGRPNFLFENIKGQKNLFIAFKVQGDGKRVNKDAIGAKLIFRIGNKIFKKEVVSSRGTYCSQDTRIIYFGFEKFKKYIEHKKYIFEIEWPDGNRQIFFDRLEFNSFYKIVYKEKIRKL